MTIAQIERDVARLVARTGLLRMDRTDISFHNIDDDHVRIVITVHNRGLGRSRQTEAVLRAAPLGAFVPWTPLATIQIPGVDAGESIEVSTVVPRPAAAPQGFFDDGPPRKPTAVGSGEEDGGKRKRSTDRRGLSHIVRIMIRMLWKGNDRPCDAPVSVPLEMPDLLSDSNPHWAGNINVLMNDQDVERHMTHALRIYPARTNLAMFFVGDHRPDDYMFQMKGPGAEWDAALYNSSNLQSLLVRPESNPALQQSQWLSMDKTQVMLVGISPAGRLSSR